jgi:predicted  nucleic acid-binding Zn-ribbon protein
MGAISDLYRLQLVDLELDESRQRLATVESGLGETADLRRARGAVVEVQAELEALRTRLRKVEREAGDFEARLKESHDRLYGKDVTDTRSAVAAQQEFVFCQGRLAELEDEQLDILIALEDGEAELAERQARQIQIEAAWREEQTALRAEQAELQARVRELADDVRGLRARVGSGNLDLYDDLRPELGGRVVATLKRGVCQACGVNVPTGVARIVERGGGMHFCPVCGRVLYGGG